MTSANVSAHAVCISGIAHVEATETSPPPGWALMERQLINFMETAVDLAAKK